MVKVRWTLSLLVVAACSSTATPPTRPTDPTGSGSSRPIATVADAPTERECEQLVAHAVALGAAERTGRPPDQHSTEADQDHVRTRLRPFIDECRALPRDSYRCAIAATAISELAACHSTRSSSTSNSSVAPPGITPPAPAAP
jgi:hypothetical protein